MKIVVISGTGLIGSRRAERKQNQTGKIRRVLGEGQRRSGACAYQLKQKMNISV